jgi:hypothetical protein
LDIQTILAPVAGMLPAAWGDDVRLAAALAGTSLAILVITLILARLFGHKAPGPGVSGVAASLPAMGRAETAKRHTLCAPDLDPEEWMSGNVIHFDRHKAVGLIRCDRVKGHVRFEAADFRRAPRVGEAVRFKGRHGARRRPVAYVVERLPGEKRAG